MNPVKIEKMDGPAALNGDTHVGSEDPTPLAPRDLRIPVKDQPMTRRTADDKTAVYPRLPSQNVVDAVYAIKTVGLMSSLFIAIVIGCIWVLPWIGTNVVIPGVKIGESVVRVAENGTVLSAELLEQNKHLRAMLESQNELHRMLSEKQK